MSSMASMLRNRHPIVMAAPSIVCHMIFLNTLQSYSPILYQVRNSEIVVLAIGKSKGSWLIPWDKPCSRWVMQPYHTDSVLTIFRRPCRILFSHWGRISCCQVSSRVQGNPWTSGAPHGHCYCWVWINFIYKLLNCIVDRITDYSISDPQERNTEEESITPMEGCKNLVQHLPTLASSTLPTRSLEITVDIKQFVSRSSLCTS